MASAEATLKRRDMLLVRIKDMFSQVRVYRLSARHLRALERELYASSDWQRLPGRTREFLLGYICACREYMMCDSLVWSYEVNGKRLPIDSEEYAAILPREIHEKHGHTGAFVWRDDPACIW